ncbi:MAG: lipoyl synthase [Clostridiales Family XIII bacterium]|jgi:lipoic acid synthetase|nr:lipoyl synthase [Clostridiales Family XIII bacterium]
MGAREPGAGRHGAAGPKPEWLKKRLRPSEGRQALEGLIDGLGLNTVCREAQCPNYLECFASGTATFMLLGATCTRGCAFCAVSYGKPEPLDPSEPGRVAEAVARLGLRYAVVTSVTRDDLDDGGAAQFAETIRAIRAACPDAAVEALIPDFQGDAGALALVAAAKPAVISHNMETVRELYPLVRPQADYRRSLELIGRIGGLDPGIRSKSGIMLGLGESRAQVLEIFDDLRAAGCSILTMGQYLAPSEGHYAVREYVHPDRFREYKAAAEGKGFGFVASAPFVRSSYNAGEALEGAQT